VSCSDGDGRPVFLDTSQLVLLSRISVSNGKSWNEGRRIPGRFW